MFCTARKRSGSAKSTTIRYSAPEEAVCGGSSPPVLRTVCEPPCTGAGPMSQSAPACAAQRMAPMREVQPAPVPGFRVRAERLAQMLHRPARDRASLRRGALGEIIRHLAFQHGDPEPGLLHGEVEHVLGHARAEHDALPAVHERLERGRRGALHAVAEIPAFAAARRRPPPRRRRRRRDGRRICGTIRSARAFLTSFWNADVGGAVERAPAARAPGRCARRDGPANRRRRAGASRRARSPAGWRSRHSLAPG